MGSINAIDNYDRLARDFLDQRTRRLLGGESLRGEHVQVAAIDGRFRVLDARTDGSRDDGVRWRRATLMMTERHAIAYQARGGFRRDYGIAVPYRSLSVVSYCLIAARRGKMATIGMRFEPVNGCDPMLEFATDVDDAFAYDATIKAVLTACSIGGVRTSDESDRTTMDALGLRPVPDGNYADIGMATASAFEGTTPSGASRDGSPTVDAHRHRPRAYATAARGVTQTRQRQPQQTRQDAHGERGAGMANASRGIGTRGMTTRADDMPADAMGGSPRRAVGSPNEVQATVTVHTEPLRGDVSVASHHDGIVAASNENSGGNRLRRSHMASSDVNQNGTYR